MAIILNDLVHDDVSVILRRLLTTVIKSKRTLFATAHKQITANTSNQYKTSRPAQHEKSTETVRICQWHEAKAIAKSLAISFADDPVAMYFVNVPDTASWTAKQKWALHEQLMEAVVRWHMLDGVVTTIGDNYGCVALWMPPNSPADPSLTTWLRSGLWKLSLILSAEGRRRWFSYFMPMLHDVKHSVLGARDDDAWYLVYLGTRPEARRKGYARALVAQVADQCDVQGRPMYLESSKAVNVGIYTKFGFEKRVRVDMPDVEHTIPVEIMVREPVMAEKI